jgi:hypothetical protein
MFAVIRETVFGKKEPFQTPSKTKFILPIEYNTVNQTKQITQSVKEDLDLVNVYKHICHITNTEIGGFEQSIIDSTASVYTTSTPYLVDTQSLYKKWVSTDFSEKRPVQSKHMESIYSSIYEDEMFMDKYNFMDIEMLSYLNNSSAYLQSLSVVQLISPLSSIVVPILMCLIPFVLLKIKGIQIDLTTYVNLLKEIGKNHFIGKTLVTIKEMSFYNFCKLCLLVGFYCMQIYQNIKSLHRYYRNIKQLNDHVFSLKQYLQYMSGRMQTFLDYASGLPSYSTFCKQILTNQITVRAILADLEDITPFTLSVRTFNSLGYLLKCYYQLHDSSDIQSCMQFVFGFDGYINVTNAVAVCIGNKKINYATFTEDNKKTKLMKQIYPFQIDLVESESKGGVANTCELKKNMIITGVNASGKTTLLKTTAINILFSQYHGCGFYEACRLSVYSHIHSYLNIPDTSGRDSLFQAEARRCKQILDIIETRDEKERHFCIFDELYSGTNPTEASKIAFSFLVYLSKYKHVDFMMTTHYIQVCKRVKKHAAELITNYQMDTIFHSLYTEYTYKLKKGICEKEGAVTILKSLEYPIDIINTLLTNFTK